MNQLISKFSWAAVTFLVPTLAFAEEHAAGGGVSWAAIGAGIAMGLAVFGAAMGQGKIGAAFMEGAFRNPAGVNATKTFLILGLIFVETLVLFTLLISLMLVQKV